MSDLETDSSDDDVPLDSADGDLLDVAAVTSPAIRRQQAARQQADSLLQDRRVQAFLGALRQGESNGQYNKIVNGGTADGRFINGGTFGDYSQHPNKSVPQPDGKSSTAAGAYQITFPTWRERAQGLGLKDFSPDSQDLAAVDLLQQTGAIDKLRGGDLNGAIYSAAKSWESLPAGGNEKSRLGAPRPGAIQSFTNEYNHRLYGPP